MVVHFAGEPSDMPRLGALARRYGFALIEDAAHAFGARQGGRPIGACEHSAITVFSTRTRSGAVSTRVPSRSKQKVNLCK